MVKNLPTIERSTRLRYGKNCLEDQAENTIVFNASNTHIDASNPGALYLSPIRFRQDYSDPNVVLLMYDKGSKEITESGESASDIIFTTLNGAVVRGNTASVDTVIFSNAFNAFVTTSNVGIVNTNPQHTLSVGSNLYVNDQGSNVLTVIGNIGVTNDVSIDGNLSVSGTTTVIYTENTKIKDAIIELGTNNTSTDTTLDLGLLLNRPDSNVMIAYRETQDEIAIGYTSGSAEDKTITPLTSQDINVHIYGQLFTEANVGIINTNPVHSLDIGSNLYVDDLATNVLVVDGSVDFTNVLTIGDNTHVGNELHVENNTYMSRDLSVSGNTYITGNVIAKNDLSLTGNAYVSGNVSITKELTVSSNLYADKDLEVAGNAYISGNVSFTKDLLVTGNAYVSGNVSVTKELTVSSNLYADKDLEVIGNVYVDGNVVAYKDLLLTGNAYVSGNVNITDQLTITGNVYADKDLELVGNAYVTGNVNITDQLTVTGNVYADKDLEVVGNVYIDGNVVAYKDLLVTGNAYVSGNISVTDQLTVTGNVYADKDLELVGNAYVSGNVVASKDLTLAGNAYVSGNVVASKDLTLTGNAYVSGNVNVTKHLSVTGNAYVSGNVEVTKALIVSANTHLKGDNVFITNTLDFLDPKTAIVTDQVSNVQIRLGQLENVSNTASNPHLDHVLRYVGGEWSNDYPQQNFMRVKNGYSIAEGRTLYKGNTVYVSATQNAGLVQVKGAQSHVASEMPCIGLVYEDIGPENEGVVLTYGVLKNLNTSHLTAGGTVYVSNVYSGYYTSVKPDDDVAASPDLIQNLGICTRSHASSGAIFVTGIGRANDIPNAQLVTSNAYATDLRYVYVNYTNNDIRKIDPMKLPTKLQALPQVVATGNTATKAITVKGVRVDSGDGYDGNVVVAGDVSISGLTDKYIPYIGAGDKYLRNSHMSQESDRVVFDQGVEITGDLVVNGSQIISSQADLIVQDRIIDIANNNTDHTTDIGIIMEHPDYNIGIIHQGDHPHTLTIGYTQNGFGDEHIYRDIENLITLNVWGNVITQNCCVVNEEIRIIDGGLGINVGDGSDDDALGGKKLYVDGDIQIGKTANLYVDVSKSYVGICTNSPESNLYVAGNVHVESNITTASNVLITGDAAATSTTTGALQVTGGVGIQGSIYATTGIFSTGTITGDLTVDTDTLVVDSDNDYVGINKAAPAVALDVVGDGAFTGDVSAATFTGGTVSGTTGTFSGDLVVNTNTLVVDVSETKVGINKAVPTVALDVVGSGAFSSDVSAATFTGGTVSGTTGTFSGDLAVDTDTLMVDSSNDRVGINKAVPTVALDVVGDGAFSGDVSAATFTGGTVSGTTGTFSGDLVVNTNTLVVDVSETKVGINKALPAVALDVVGSGAFSGDLAVDTDTLMVDSSNDRVGINKAAPAVALDVVGAGAISGDLAVDTDTLLVDSSNDRVGINKAVPTVALDVVGGGAFSGDVSAASFTGGTVSGTTGTFTGVTSVTDSTASTSKGDGALVVSGGVGITGDIYAADATFDNLSVAADTDIVGTIGRAKVGYVGYSDTAGLAHYDFASAGNYAFLQNASGKTFVNSPTGQSIAFREGNADKMILSGGNLGINETSPATKLHVAGGTIMNSDAVAKKTYSYTSTIAGGTTIANATITINFTARIFSARIIAHLIESDDEMSAMSIECCGGHRTGGTPLSIVTGPVSIFGNTSTNPWDPTITTTGTSLSIKPSTDIDSGIPSANYNIFIEYLSADTNGKVIGIDVGGSSVTTFNY